MNVYLNSSCTAFKRCTSLLGQLRLVRYTLPIVPQQSCYRCHCSKPTPSRTRHLTFDRCVSTPSNRDSIVYLGPLTSAVRGLKLVSISTAALAVFLNPLLIYCGNPDTPLVGRVAMASFVTCIGISTTVLLHWFIKGYITKLFYDRSTGSVTAETLTLFGRRKLTSFHISEARPPDSVSAFSTFQGGGKNFFMHTEMFKDPELLRQLLGNYNVFEKNNKK